MAFPKNQFRRALNNWYRKNGRDLPWRRTRDPYAILVSEFMLQQTQVATVIPYYDRWLFHFPNFAALAAASENDVLHLWQGLGYYSRARNLHALAKILQDRHRGKLPNSIEKMRRLPGIGKYTAHAVVSFAFNRPVPIVETNTSRVLARLFNLKVPIDSTAGQQRLWHRASELIPKVNSADFNSGLMDLGALVCLPRNPKCQICPVEKFCRATNPEALPIKKLRARARQQLTEDHIFIFRSGKILLRQSCTRWRHMWILPPISPDGFEAGSATSKPVHISTFPFTHYRVTLRVFRHRHRPIDGDNACWFPIGSINSIPVPSPHRRAIMALVSAHS